MSRHFEPSWVKWAGGEPTSSPGPSPHSKWWSEQYSMNCGVFCHMTHDEIAFFGGCFQHLAALFAFCNRKPLFKQNESCLRDKILTNFWSHFGSLGQGFLRPPFWKRRPWGWGWRRTPVYRGRSRGCRKGEKKRKIMLKINPPCHPSPPSHHNTCYM